MRTPRSDLRLRPRGRAVAPFGAEEAGQEHDAPGEHEPRRDGTVFGGGGATTAVVFEKYVKKVLAPSLEEGRVVVMDNLGAHRPKRAREVIERRGCQPVYLPSYSPDYNPIEEAFAKIKGLLRQAAARTKEALVEAI